MRPKLWKLGKKDMAEKLKTLYDSFMDFHTEDLAVDLVDFSLIGLIIALGALVGMGRLSPAIRSEFTTYAARLS